MTWEQFTYMAIRGFSSGFGIGSFFWLVRRVAFVFSAFFRPPRLD